MPVRDDSASGGQHTVTVKLPAVLVDLFPGSSRIVEIEARTVGEVIDGLDGLWPGMGDRLRDSRPSIRRHINIFVDGERTRLDTQLDPGAEVFVLVAISGG